MEIDVEAAEAVTALQVTEVDRLKAANLQLKILLLQERRNNTIRARRPRFRNPLAPAMIIVAG